MRFRGEQSFFFFFLSLHVLGAEYVLLRSRSGVGLAAGRRGGDPRGAAAVAEQPPQRSGSAADRNGGGGRHGAAVPGWVAPPADAWPGLRGLILGIVGLVPVPDLPSIPAVIFGLAKGEIDGAGGQLGGRGIAMTGLILGWIGVAFWDLIFLVVVAVSV